MTRSRIVPALVAAFLLSGQMWAQQEVFSAGDKGVIPPRVVNLAKPTYTAAALERRIEGTVNMAAVVLLRRQGRRRREDPPVSRSGARRAGGGGPPAERIQAWHEGRQAGRDTHGRRNDLHSEVVSLFAGSARLVGRRLIDFTAQGVGFHPVASGSFLKSEVVMYGRVK